MRSTMTVATASLFAFTVAANASESPDVRTVAESFVFNASCERGISHLSLEHVDGDSYVDIGSIGPDDVQTAEGAAILGDEALAVVGEAFMSDGYFRSQLSSCVGRDEPTVFGLTTIEGETATESGASVCYPVKHCGLFDWFCGFVGGTLHKFEATPISGAHHACVLPQKK